MARTFLSLPDIFVSARRASLITAAVASVVVIAGLGFGTRGFLGGDRIAPGVIGAGVSLTGKTSREALPVMAERLAILDQTRVQIRAGGSVWEPTLSELGLSIEPATVVSQLMGHGRTGSVGDRVTTLAWSLIRPVEVAVPVIDRTRLETWIAKAATEFDRSPTNAVVSISPNGETRLVPERNGIRLNQIQATKLVEPAVTEWVRNWIAGQRLQNLSLTLPVVDSLPSIASADFQVALEDSRVLQNRPLTLRNDRISVEIDRAEVAAIISIQTTDGKGRVVADTVAVDRLLDRTVTAFDRAPVNASIAIRPDATIETVADVPGWKLDRVAAKQAIMQSIVQRFDAALSMTLPGQTIEATVRAADFASLRAEAERALGSPINFTVGTQSLTLETADIAPLLTIVSNPDGRSSLRIDAAPLKARVAAFAKEVEREPRNGRLHLVGGNGTPPSDVVASMPGGGEGSTLQAIEEGIHGQRLDVDKAMQLIASQLSSVERRIALPIDKVPAITSADRGVFGPMDLIDAGTTTYSGGIAERTHNVELAASRLNGAIVPPGQIFSFNRALGATTTENGYQVAWGIMSSTDPKSTAPKTVPSVGGGICQVATTLFHAVFWSGYQIEERNWHLYWIPKYGVGPRGLQGLDATVDEEFDVDFQWMNTTNTPVLIQARTDGSRISFALFGEKSEWQVQVSPPVIDKIVPAPTGTFRQMEPSMPVGKTLMVEEARDGFRSTIVRTVLAPKVEPRVLKLVSLYQPARNVLLIGGVPTPIPVGSPPASTTQNAATANGAGAIPVAAPKPAATVAPGANATEVPSAPTPRPATGPNAQSKPGPAGPRTR